MIGQLIAHYRIIDKLGEGGMGAVYLAEDTRLQRKVALKMLAPDFTRDSARVRRFEQEARAVSALNHPNILTIHEIGEWEGALFMATEYIDGETLRARLRTTRLKLFEALEIALQIASALSAAHPAGIIHRDIKPENIMLRRDGYVKILDFGLAKFTEQQPQANPERPRVNTNPGAGGTASGVILGTPEYMSPEQLRGLALDERADIFSFGVVFYEMIAGQQPFDGLTVTDLLVSILNEEPPPLRQVTTESTPELERIMAKMLRKDRDQRYRNIDEVIFDLKTLKQRLEFEAELLKSSGSLKVGEIVSSLQPYTGSGELPAVITASHPAAGKKYHRTALTLVAAGALVLTALFGYLAFLRDSKKRGEDGTRTLAILPFRNLKPDAETDFLGFSLADAVINRLVYIQTLNVRPSSSIDKYRNQEIDTKKVARELQVDALMVGTFVKDGDDLRITVQLIDADNNEIIWRDSLDLKYDKLLTVQDLVADNIVKGLQLKLTPKEAERLGSDVPTNPTAYDFFLRGRDHIATRKYERAIEVLEQSVALDANYAPAWAFLGRAYTTTATQLFGGREFYEKAVVAYNRALKINPEQVDARIFLALHYTDTGRVEEAVPILRGILKTNPNFAPAHYDLSYAYRYGGMLAASIEEGERALEIDPRAATRTLNSYFYAGQYQRFIDSLPEQDVAYYTFYRGLGYYYLKDYKRAAAIFNRAYDQEASLIVSQIGRALALSIEGQPQPALEFLKASEKKVEERGVADGEMIYKFAQAYAVLGERAAALRMFRRTIELGFFCHPYFLSDPLLENIRREPEYQELMELARKRHEEFKKKFF